MTTSRTIHPHPAGEILAERAVIRAQALACAVRESVAEVDEVVRNLGRDELVALAVALAAMVDVDRPASELLAWLNPDPDTFAGWAVDDLCAAHTQWNAGRRDEWARTGERLYMQRRYLRRKAARTVQVAS